MRTCPGIRCSIAKQHDVVVQFEFVCFEVDLLILNTVVKINGESPGVRPTYSAPASLSLSPLVLIDLPHGPD